MRETDVLIIGGGLGGLCLAQGLRRAGVEVTVCERDGSVDFRAQGYRITLKASGAGALHECLPPRLFELCVATAIRSARRMIFMDEQLNPKFHKPIPPVEPGPAGFGVNRRTLREILLAGLGAEVRFGKTFQRYEQAGAGRVRAWFTDGTSITADLLVGADGTNSAVRRQLLPDAVVDELHRAIYGRTPIGPATLDRLPEVLIDTFNSVIGPGHATMSVATCRTREPVPEAEARLAPGLGLTDIPGYLSWTVPMVDERLVTADPGTLHRAAGELVAGWHPALGGIIAEADVAATFPVRITSARPVQPWDTPNVTLLGDAVHTMSPGRGDGANIALRDAALLCRTIVEGTPKARYEAEMLAYGFQAVAASRDNPFRPRVSPSPPVR